MNGNGATVTTGKQKEIAFVGFAYFSRNAVAGPGIHALSASIREIPQIRVTNVGMSARGCILAHCHKIRQSCQTPMAHIRT
jgi:hypothetical protein